MISWNGKDVTTKTIAAGRYDDMIQQRARADEGPRPAGADPLVLGDGRQQEGRVRRHPRAVHRRLAAHRRGSSGPRAPTTSPGSGAPTPRPSTTARPSRSIPATISSTGRAPTDTTGPRAGPVTTTDRSRTSSPASTAGPPSTTSPSWWASSAFRNAIPAKRRSGSPTPAKPSKRTFRCCGRSSISTANKDYDWRLTTSDSAVDAFRQMANDPYFNLGSTAACP